MSSFAGLIVNFGGPRDLSEIEPFLCELLTDKDVVRTKLPQALHNLLFRRIAKKRALSIREDYASIGGKSPIFSDTEWMAEQLRQRLNIPFYTFHRYLPSTHAKSLAAIGSEKLSEIRVFPMFPQFSFATTGSIARYFSKNLSKDVVNKLRWIKSYPTDPLFVESYQNSIRKFFVEKNLKEEEVCLLFSAHGLPQSFVDKGDTYQYECESSYRKIMEGFSLSASLLSYQSKFGPGEWLRPYTEDVANHIERFSEGRKKIIFIPISFTSDHIETLFEVESLYMPVIEKKGYEVYRMPAPNRNEEWVRVVESLIREFCPSSTNMLIRRS